MEVVSSKSKPSLPSPHATQTQTAQDLPSQEQTVSVTPTKLDEQQKSIETSTLTAKASTSALRIDEEPVIKLTPEHGKLLNDFLTSIIL